MNDYLYYIGLIVIIGIYFYRKIKKSKKASQMIDSGSIIIDVRTPQEFKSGHYPNSISIPLDTLKNNLDKIKGYKNGIVVVCASGMRSGQAKSILSNNGIESFNGGSWKNP
tara:strand:- start:130 stop:462 length:333 start_codon:yes stop_codon:yes gene_type:complete